MTNYKKHLNKDLLKDVSSFNELIEVLHKTSEELKEMKKFDIIIEITDQGDYCFSTKDAQIAKKFGLKPEHIWIEDVMSKRKKIIKRTRREMKKDIKLMHKINLKRKA